MKAVEDVENAPPAADGAVVVAPFDHARTLPGPGGGSSLRGRTDADAISAWLMARAGRSRHTFASYHLQAQRLLAWMTARRLNLAVLTVEDARGFLATLGSPENGASRARGAASVAYAHTVLTQMSAWLKEAGHVERNAFALLSRPAVVRRSMGERHLSPGDWRFLWQWVQEQDEAREGRDAVAARRRWLFALLYNTGLRLSEAANGRMGDFVHADGLWRLRVVGKGARERLVSVNSVLLRELQHYRAGRFATPLPQPGEPHPLLGHAGAAGWRRRLTPRGIEWVVRETAHAAATTCEDAHMRSRLMVMSPHWLRHTFATHRFLAGAALETTQDELGHQDPKTTRIYSVTTGERRHVDAERLATLIEPAREGVRKA